MDDPMLARLIQLQRRIETLGELNEQLAVIIERQFAMMRAMLAGEAPPPPPLVN